MSLDSKYPLGCKTATVSPYAERENYRPVLPLPLISKVVKRVGNKHIIENFKNIRSFLIINLILDADILSIPFLPICRIKY